MKGKIHNISIIVIIFLAAIFVAVSMSGFNSNVNFELEEEGRENLQSIANKQQLSINREFFTETTIITNISRTLAVIGYDEATILEYMITAERDFAFENLVVVDTNGIGILSNGDIVSLVQKDYFESVLSGETVISKPYVSAYSGKDVLAFSAPVYFEGEIQGVVSAEYTLEYVDSLLESTLDAAGYAFILSEHGDVLVSSDEEGDFDNIFKLDYIGDEDEVINDIENGIHGSATFTLDGERYIVEYRPLDANDWSIAFVSSEGEITKRVDTISTNMFVVSIVIAICFTIILAYIYQIKKNAVKEIENIAYKDDLTGLLNLTGFKKETLEMILHKKDTNYVMVKMDIINFKAINEMFDYEAGNLVLKAVAKTGENVTEKTFRLARTGDDEFMMFAGNGVLDNLEDTSVHYENVFREYIPVLEKHQFKFRYGRYFIQEGETDIDSIVNKTSMAHSLSKNMNNFCDYDEEYKAKILKHTEITNKMEQALRDGEFKVFLQPKYNVKNNDVTGAEALVRWVESSGNMIFPDEFIPLFESNGFIEQVDKFMLESVCEMLERWIKIGYKAIPISVNFSRVHLKNEKFAEDIESITNKYDVPREFIEIEITETAVTQSKLALEKTLENLQNAGFSVSIDDFGAGYSSLGMLKSFKANTLKLDRSFFKDNEGDRGELVIDSIIKLAHNLGMGTVAEGVEVPEQAKFLKEIDCESAQGYLYAKPMTVRDFEEIYLK